MKYLCINNTYPHVFQKYVTDELFNITINKVYEVLDQTKISEDTWLYIVDDRNVKCYYLNTCFKSLEDIRDEKLNILT